LLFCRLRCCVIHGSLGLASFQIYAPNRMSHPQPVFAWLSNLSNILTQRHTHRQTEHASSVAADRIWCVALRCGLELSVDGRSIVDGDARRRRVRRCGQTQQYRCSSRCLCAGEDSSLSPATTSSTMTASGGLSHWAATTHCVSKKTRH